MIQRIVAVAGILLLVGGLTLGWTTPSWADPYRLTDEVGAGVHRLAGEAKDLAVAVVDPDGALWGTLATAAALGLTYTSDDRIRDKLAGIHGSRLDKAADAGSFIGNPFLHLGVAAAVYGGGILADSPKHKELGEMLGEAVLLADGVTIVLKEATGRARPLTGADKDRFRPLQFKTDYDSFPSMHTASSFAMASVMAATSENWTTGALYYAAAGFVGFSRLYQNKHWASDVVLGAALGELCGRVVTRYHADSSRRLMVTPQVADGGLGLALVGKF
jgi:membrane-associated phospholipid phosphatase